MDNNFQIGTTKLDGGGFAKKNHFHLQPGNNAYRILPPMFSLAPIGKYAEFYAVHWVFTDTKGNRIPFLCVETKDKNKMITTHCPICIKANEAQAKYDAAKASGATKEQLEKFRVSILQRLKADKKFFLNAMNQAGEIGVLAIPYKSFQSLKALLEEQSEKGFDPTGKFGCFLNFKKTQAYKGDVGTAYSVELAVETFKDNTGQMIQKIKQHELTADIINRLSQEARDLSCLYKTLTPEQLEILVHLSGAEQSQQFEKFLGFQDKPEPVAAVSSSIPGTNAMAIATPVFSGNTLEFAQFGQPTTPPAPTVVDLAMDIPFDMTPQPQQQLNGPPKPASIGTSAVNGKTMDISQLSDDAFLSAFMPK
jgi:hypothetical protein